MVICIDANHPSNKLKSPYMKRILLLVILLSLSPKGFAQLFVENFSYPNGSFLFQTGNWTNIGQPESPILVSGPGLTFPGYWGSGIGNLASVSSYGNGVYSLFSSTETDGSVYAYFMFKALYPFTEGVHFFALRSSEGEQFAQVHFKEFDSPQFQLAITKSQQSFTNFTSPLYNVGTTYLLVVKYKFISGNNNDEVSLFVFDTSNPPPATEPAPTIVPESNSPPDAANLNGVVLWQGDGQSPLLLFVDGIYAYKGWFPETALPVELSSFTSSVSGNTVTLNWTTSVESNNSRFEIERSVNEEWIRTGTVMGSGTTSQQVSYSFSDRNLSPGNYKYRLKQIDFNGNFNYHNLANEVLVENPNVFRLEQNFPNPFNPATTIRYQIPVNGKVSLKVYDMTGKEVVTLLNEFQSAGYNTVELNASELSSGMYFYGIEVQSDEERFHDMKKMVLIK